jgi:hypothetical protein
MASTLFLRLRPFAHRIADVSAPHSRLTISFPQSDGLASTIAIGSP